MSKQTMPTTELYFEAHVTVAPIDPVEFPINYAKLCEIAKHHGFRVAEFLYKKTKIVANPDDFLTTRSKDWFDIYQRTGLLVDDLIEDGFIVLRYKIENTLIDVHL